MPSIAYENWLGERSAGLDEIEGAHRVIRGSGSGRRAATQQLNQAYAVLLSSQFQGFCRDLHAECADLLGLTAGASMSQAIYVRNLRFARKLDAGNPNPGNIGADYNRLGLAFWSAVDGDHARNPRRKALLERMNRWRNAIAHNSFDADMCRATRPTLSLAEVQDWRKACDGLARSFDNVLRAHLLSVTAAAPW